MIKNNFLFKYFIPILSILIIIYFSVYIYNYYSTNDILLHIPDNKVISDQNKQLHLKPNEIGDSIGGILNPLIGLVAAIFTFLAFLMQVYANEDIKRQFIEDKFEGRLFKLMDIYKDNVARMHFKSRESGTKHTDKSVFPTLYEHFLNLFNEISEFNGIKKIDILDKASYLYKEELISMNKEVDLKNWLQLELSYIILFYGVGKKGRENVKFLIAEKYDDYNYLDQILNYLSFKPAILSEDYDHFITWKNLNIEGVDFNNACSFSFNRYYEGIQNNFAHYYRSLFAMINYLNNSKNLNYLDKWDFSKLFRSQMSNHEQIFFFLNSISILGRKWELDILVTKDNIQDENKRLVTKYDLIKNIPIGERSMLNVNMFYPNVEYENRKETKYRKNLNEKIYK
ncbi:putative phage abortive infection protein [Chryseobacterium sp.]|uniref:putative phage abortive infection protein n=1 Tax=Chryseobacterium sp. TaxID=1871047 RepID=UPI002899D7FF|nr:putative phage abortive infection protein [Chryseobacterium sp.]